MKSTVCLISNQAAKVKSQGLMCEKKIYKITGSNVLKIHSPFVTEAKQVQREEISTNIWKKYI